MLIDGAHREKQEHVFDENAERLWKKFVPSGSVDVQSIYGLRGVTEYVVKAASDALQYERFVTPDELARG
jgi:hypothetical protein